MKIIFRFAFSVAFAMLILGAGCSQNSPTISQSPAIITSLSASSTIQYHEIAWNDLHFLFPAQAVIASSTQRFNAIAGKDWKELCPPVPSDCERGFIFIIKPFTQQDIRDATYVKPTKLPNISDVEYEGGGLYAFIVTTKSQKRYYIEETGSYDQGVEKSRVVDYPIDQSLENVLTSIN